MTYPDPNVQLWASYYAQGGTDPTGAVYFISVPGVKEASPSPAAAAPEYPAGQSSTIGSTAPLNIQHGSAQSAGTHAPGSPGSQHQAPQAFYQANPADPNASNASLSSAPGQHAAYGASPYPAAGGYAQSGATSPAGDAPAWAGSYGNLPNQFADLNVNGDGQPQTSHPGPHPGAQGVGAPA